ncbi:MAG: hypothetical protein Q8N99_02540 [Nanoarchaeota archaeon]|nr:hypothetical protein [Nanoarchaeota archaeon]
MKRVQEKRIWLFIILSLIMIFSILLVSAAPIDTIKELLKSGEGLQYYSSGFLLLLLVILIIYAVSDFVPFLKDSEPAIRISVSVIIGILSVVYLTPEEIRTALMGYKALGIILTTIVPLIFLMSISIKWNTTHPEYSFISTILWVGFFTAYLIKYFQSLVAVWVWLNTGGELRDPNGIGWFGVTFILITGLISLAMVIASGTITRWFFKYRVKRLIEGSEIKTAAERTARIAMFNEFKNFSPEDAAIFDAEIRRLKRLRVRP